MSIFVFVMKVSCSLGAIVWSPCPGAHQIDCAAFKVCFASIHRSHRSHSVSRCLSTMHTPKLGMRLSRLPVSTLPSPLGSARSSSIQVLIIPLYTCVLMTDGRNLQVVREAVGWDFSNVEMDRLSARSQMANTT